ncbi:unnamed protein product [Protopolystoma xenopodis]|uniref:Uncharacterized protein n=1 Tax=Protopolystoma xenopodis TaxID=117903 RepID=A0A3S5BQ53_9PLAT|nr:unnamed protein product [Protopolystoma xenopodis]
MTALTDDTDYDAGKTFENTCAWLIRHIMRPHSPLALCLLRGLDAGVSHTDSSRLADSKRYLHQHALPSLLTGIFSRLRFLAGRYTEEIASPGHTVLGRHSASSLKSEGPMYVTDSFFLLSQIDDFTFFVLEGFRTRFCYNLFAEIFLISLVYTSITFY